jgi:hypothetical protein
LIEINNNRHIKITADRESMLPPLYFDALSGAGINESPHSITGFLVACLFLKVNDFFMFPAIS